MLDNLCEGINDERTKKNDADKEEKSLIGSALSRMVKKGVQVYRHGGVELARVPGAEKLRVRLTKEQGDADAGDLEVSDEPQDQDAPDSTEELAGIGDEQIEGEVRH